MSNNGHPRNNSINTSCIITKHLDLRIGHNYPFYHYKEHPEYPNIHLEVIESHLILSKDHKKGNVIEGEKRSV